MGFFKGIGKMIKKNVNFKTLVKTAGQGLSFVPGVGGIAGQVITDLQSAHEAKRAGQAEQAQEYTASAAQKVGKKVGSIAGQFGSQVLNNTLNSAGEEINVGLGKLGANVADNAIKEWFKKHWKTLVGGVVGVVALVFLAKRFMGNKRRVSTPYRR